MAARKLRKPAKKKGSKKARRKVVRRRRTRGDTGGPGDWD